MTEEQTRFTDIHSHFLFSVDDGSKNKLESLNMLQQATEQNISHLLATPHATDLTTEAVSERFLDHFKKLQDLIAGDNIGIKISLASELYFSPKIYDWIKYPWATFDNNRKYLLFELPLFEMPREVKEFIFQCKLEGITPILAHPERYSYMSKNVEVLFEWHRQGCLMQINAGSITGQFGSRAEKLALQLIQARLAHFVASDAHETEYRNYKQLPKAREVLAAQIPKDYLNELFSENPQNALDGLAFETREADERLIEDSWFSYQGILNKINKVFHL